ncbi:MAG: GNAT family N-acetyltransferase [Gemmatimonadota bacterium]|nr:GNAT family N-acetyltransferase [Gemmatimonadota bacterium]
MTRWRRASLERGADDRTVFAALRDGVVVGYSWWAPDFDAALDFSPLFLPQNAIFHRFVHVERTERHRGTASALFSAGELYFFERGIESCWFLIPRSRSASISRAR